MNWTEYLTLMERYNMAPMTYNQWWWSQVLTEEDWINLDRYTQHPMPYPC